MKWWWLVLGLASGCGAHSDADSDAGSDAGIDAGVGGCDAGATIGDLPAGVVDVLQSKCVPCHSRPPKNHAPFSLETYEDTQQPFGFMGARRWNRMAQVIEPGALPHMPPIDAGQLDAGDFDVLHAWFTACAPGLPEDGGDPGEDGGP